MYLLKADRKYSQPAGAAPADDVVTEISEMGKSASVQSGPEYNKHTSVKNETHIINTNTLNTTNTHR